MKGPPPKDPRLRQRTNKSTTATTFAAEPVKRRRVPKLPAKEGGWLKATTDWWRTLWRSPMADAYLDTDVHGLYVLAELIDGFWRKPSHFRAAEIRLQGQNYGLSPLDRRRLEWTIEEPDEAPRREPTEREDEADREANDPRRLFALVQ